ncbi:hypothetical protein Cci01nite_79870 [Catellatospora citrea]|uniref:KARI N-terminal Rossmann domain-containing protein n=1 Tax=Catellatospora citrea TaxID=53366 RepID=A0A8J3KQ96_9ACTN|nr:acetohydroxy acid isomeroreductase-like protein [Catellatospora citrea]GIG02894.1 hypothetical protein Cci01nite_79870 [Catellatospora citrea]
MSIRVYYDNDAELSFIRSRRIAVIGFGEQGQAHALSLRDSGVEVTVGLRPGSPSRSRAQDCGLDVRDPAVAAAWADVIMVLVPDVAHRALHAQSIAPHLTPGKMLLIGNTLAARYGLIKVPPQVTLALIAPNGPGNLVREQYLAGGGVPCLVSIGHNPTGDGLALALSYAKAIGATRSGVVEVDFRDAIMIGLYGERVQAAGGTAALVRSKFALLNHTAASADWTCDRKPPGDQIRQ